METAKIFNNGRSQAVRLPKECRFKGKEVYLNKVGDMVILFPKKNSWKAFLAGLEQFTDDFMAERNQPQASEPREPLP